MQDQLPRRTGRTMQWFGGWLFARMGWTSEGELPNVPQFVACVAPHTSNWDLVRCAAYMFRERLRLSFLAKHTLFFWPLAGVMRWLGGLPVNRTAASGIVGGVVEQFASSPKLIIALAPEGTRKANSRFKPGFIHMAIGARVPVLLVTIDNARKVIKIGGVWTPTGDIEKDLEYITEYYRPFQRTRHVG
jgi:1-acyl-sn-glycerol-3-phosphate acyltransferase